MRGISAGFPLCSELVYVSTTPTTSIRNISPQRQMFARVGQLARHYSRPLASYSHTSTATVPRPLIGSSIMSLAAVEDRGKRMIHTAGCIIIGDEVLGGKVTPITALVSAATC